MAINIQTLPKRTRTLMKLASCIGTQFDLPTLATISGLDPREAAAGLWKAMVVGMIIAPGENYFVVQDTNNDDSDQANDTDDDIIDDHMHDRNDGSPASKNDRKPLSVPATSSPASSPSSASSSASSSPMVSSSSGTGSVSSSSMLPRYHPQISTRDALQSIRSLRMMNMPQTQVVTTRGRTLNRKLLPETLTAEEPGTWRLAYLSLSLPSLSLFRTFVT